MEAFVGGLWEVVYVTFFALSGYGLLLAAPLALVVDKVDVLPEAVRGLYVEKDGKFHLDVDGIEDTSGLKSALEKERAAARSAAATIKALETKFKDVDPEQYRKLNSLINSNEETRLISEGKVDEVITKRTEKLRQEHVKQLEEATKATKAEQEKTGKYKQRVLDNHIRAAAIKAGLHPHAIDDALFRARTIFTLDEEGDAVQLGADGKPVYGKDGKTPFGPLEWLETMKEAAPHWFPAGSSGGGAGNGAGGAGSAKTVKRTAFEKMAPAERTKFLKDGGKVID